MEVPSDLACIVKIKRDVPSIMLELEVNSTLGMRLSVGQSIGDDISHFG